MIRHARLPAAPPVFTLPLAMILARFRAIAVTAIGAAVLSQPRLFAASRAAVALSPVTAGADQELGLALLATAKPPSQLDFAMSSHAASQAGLDKGNAFVAP
jgi:hypothetical protein